MVISPKNRGEIKNKGKIKKWEIKIGGIKNRGFDNNVKKLKKS